MYRQLSACAIALASVSASAQVTVFSNDFNGAMPAQIDSGSALLEGVQGFAGPGPLAAPSGGHFLRSATANTVTLTRTGLPAHNAISRAFLFATIDSPGLMGWAQRRRRT